MLAASSLANSTSCCHLVHDADIMPLVQCTVCILGQTYLTYLCLSTNGTVRHLCSCSSTCRLRGVKGTRDVLYRDLPGGIFKLLRSIQSQVVVQTCSQLFKWAAETKASQRYPSLRLVHHKQRYSELGESLTSQPTCDAKGVGPSYSKWATAEVRD